MEEAEECLVFMAEPPAEILLGTSGASTGGDWVSYFTDGDLDALAAVSKYTFAMAVLHEDRVVQCPLAWTEPTA